MTILKKYAFLLWASTAVVSLMAGTARGTSAGSSSAAPAVNAQPIAPASALLPPPQTHSTNDVSPNPEHGLAELLANLRANSRALSLQLDPGLNFDEPETRARLARAVIPLERRQVGILNELLKQPQIPAARITPLKQRAVATLYFFQDQPTVQVVDAMKAGSNPPQARSATAVQILSRWIAANGQPAGSNLAADELIELDRANPTDDSLALLTHSLARETHDQATADKLQDAVLGMSNPTATSLSVQIQSDRKLAALVGHPINITGQTLEHAAFATAGWKGKVVVVDFWATTNDHCKVDRAALLQLYTDYHKKGLEIVGVCNDYDRAALTDYVLNSGMPWEQLYDDDAGAARQPHPLGAVYGVRVMPTMFLIDRKGICRAVDARTKLQEMVSAFLAE